MSRPIILLFSFIIFLSGRFSQSLSISSPVISFCFTASSSRNCSDWAEISNSSSRFGNLIENSLKFSGKRQFLHLNCKASYPIRWLAGKLVKSVQLLMNSTNYNPGPYTQLQYEQEIIISWEHPEERSDIVYRCGSYQNSTLSAEVYLQPGITRRRSMNQTPSREFFMVDDNKYKSWNQTVIIPCLIGDAVLNNAKLNQTNSTNSNFDNWALLRRRHGKLVQTYLPQPENYDPRLGFSIPVDEHVLESTFECKDQKEASQESQTLVPVKLDWQVPAKLTFPKNESSEIFCDAGFKMDEIILTWRKCSTILECDLLWRPTSPIMFRFSIPKHSPVRHDEKENVTHSNLLTPLHKNGYVQCSGFTNNSTPPKFVNEVDYVFQGLDDKYYFAKKHFPFPGVIKVVDVTGTLMKPFVPHVVECKISTFLLYPYVEFVMKFNSGIPPVTVKYGSSPNDHMGANMTQLRPSLENTRMSWQLQFFPTPDLISVVCRSPWLISSDYWAEFVLETKVHKVDNYPVSWKWIIGVSAAILIIMALSVGVVVLTRKYQSACP